MKHNRHRKQKTLARHEGFALISNKIAQELRGLGVAGWADLRDEGPQRRARRQAFVPTVCAEIVHAWQTAKNGHRNAVPEMALISYETMLRLAVEAWKATQPTMVFEPKTETGRLRSSLANLQNFPRPMPPGRYSMVFDPQRNCFVIKP